MSERVVKVVQSDVPVRRWNKGEGSIAQDSLAEEVAVALVYNGISHAVMMLSPNNLKDFALGFSLSENIIDSASDLYSCEEVPLKNGIELKLEISSRKMNALKQKRRNLVGRTGCGICGAESLEQALLPLTALPDNSIVLADKAIQNAAEQLEKHQPLQAQTGAHHGAAWCNLEGVIQFVREDVGRHNALDKLIGALHSNKADVNDGFVIISSRASYEMVQKAVMASVSTLVSVSAPTAMALRIAKQVNLRLVGFARPGRHVNYTHF